MKIKFIQVAATVLVGYGLLFNVVAFSADPKAVPEVEKYIQVLFELQDDLLDRITAEKKRPRPTDETVQQKIERTANMVELLEAMEDVGAYIKQVKAKGLPENR